MLSLDPIVNVTVDISAVAAPRNGFNIGLIVGASGIIPVADRCRIYSSVDAMSQDGFAETDAEYAAALLYFGQSRKPAQLVVGAWDDNDETLLEAVQACRSRNQAWYGFYVCGATDTEIQAVAAWTATQRAVLFFDSGDETAKTAVATDIFSKLKGLGYQRVFGLYSATPHAAAAAMGFAMGANNGTANSAYTMAYKPLAGVTPDELTETEVAALKGKNANIYVSRGGSYNLLEQGVMADGTPFDEIIGLDQLSNDIQLSVMDLLANAKTKIPHTDSGMVQFIAAVNRELGAAADRGFIAPGIWNGPNVLNLETGDALETGYRVQAQSVDSQTRAERERRKAPPMYVCAKLAGAIEHVVIQINVDR